VKLTARLHKGKRRREPRFWVEARAEHTSDGRLAAITVTIRNDSDVPHHVDEALIRYDDGRVGHQLDMQPVYPGDIKPHHAITFQVPAESLLDPAGATRFRVVTFRGRLGQRLEWSSKDERFTSI